MKKEATEAPTQTEATEAPAAEEKAAEPTKEAPKAEAPKAEAPKAEAPKKPEPQRLRLQDAAKRFVADYRDHWWPSIQRFAATQNFTDPATIPECKEVLRRWGAKLK